MEIDRAEVGIKIGMEMVKLNWLRDLSSLRG